MIRDPKRLLRILKKTRALQTRMNRTRQTRNRVRIHLFSQPSLRKKFRKPIKIRPTLPTIRSRMTRAVKLALHQMSLLKMIRKKLPTRVLKIA